MISIPERIQQQAELFRIMLDDFAADLRVMLPGIVIAFNAVTQTATVQIAIRERVNLNGVLSWETLPLLVDVNVGMFRAGGYSITFPVNVGDEGLVFFADACIDAWWQSGGVQNQMDKRRHDLSDGFFIPFTWSQPRVISEYKTDAVQIRNEAGSAYVEIQGNKIIFVSPEEVQITSPLLSLLVDSIVTAASNGSGNVGTVDLNVGTLNVQAATSATIDAGGNTIVEGRNFLAHEHTDPQGGNTGGVI